MVTVITGPTAVGKTRLCLELAQRLDAEIVSIDSRQIYRRMDIGTAKPPSDSMAAVPHHFIDEHEIDEPISAGEYATEAWKRIEEIHGREKQVIAVGGSTLYLQALTQGIANVPEVDPEVRRTLMDRLATEGGANLFGELREVDPESAATMDATKSQRVVRALEVFHQTGVPLSHYHKHHIAPPHRFQVMVLTRFRQMLYERIERRVDQMLAEGLLDEVESILTAGFSPHEPALRTIGYREPIAYLSGEYDYEEMVRLIKRNTRRYAKRQLTWFRREPSYHWLDAIHPTDELVAEVLSQIAVHADQSAGKST